MIPLLIWLTLAAVGVGLQVRNTLDARTDRTWLKDLAGEGPGHPAWVVATYQWWWNVARLYIVSINLVIGVVGVLALRWTGLTVGMGVLVTFHLLVSEAVLVGGGLLDRRLRYNLATSGQRRRLDPGRSLTEEADRA